MFLAFDAESTGLLVRDKPLDDPSQPRVCQLAAVLADADFKELGSFCVLIEPSGWSMTAEAEQVHGITLERCMRFGVPAVVALAMLAQFARRCRFRVAFNDDFDRQLIRLEIQRAGSDDLGVERPRIRALDPMKIGAAANPTGDYRSLSDLYHALTGDILEGAHDAMADVRATLEILKLQIERKLVEL